MSFFSKSSPQSQLEGPKVELREDYGGLGLYYADKLYQNLEKIHQIDTVTGITETNGSVRSRAFQVAQELKRQGVVENDIILVCSRCHADQTVVVLASLLLGSIIAPVDPVMPHNECLLLVKQLKPKMCFCDLRTLKQIERVIGELGLDSKMVHFSDQQQYATAFRKLLMAKQHMEQFVPVTVEQPRKKVAFIMPTQGTTGTPKLVCLSHHFIYSQTMIYQKAVNFPQKILSFYPLSCVIQVTLMCLCFEVPIIRVLVGAFVERTTCKLTQDLKIDHIFLNTNLALKLVDDVAIRDFNLSCLKCIFVGSLAATPNDINTLINRLPKVKFVQMYSTTETGTAITCSANHYPSMERAGTIGKVVQNYKLKVVDVETRRDVEPDQSGELLIAGDCIMLGYFKNSQITKSMMHLHYFKTGDLVHYDRSGWLYLHGKIEDVISVGGGVKLPPRELEDVIMEHPFVKDAAVIGNDKEVVACVIVKEDTKLSEEKLLRYLSPDGFISDKVEPEKLPNRIIFMDNFPTTPLGKIRRDKLREEILKVKIELSDSAAPLIHLRNVSDE